MSDVSYISSGYSPRVHQQYLHGVLNRFNVLVCHRRFGKTVFSINEMVDKGLRCDLKRPQYAYVAPTYGQAKRVAWEILKDATKNYPIYEKNEAELRIDLKRPNKDDFIRFQLLGAENPDSIRGIYLDGVILDEYALMNPTIWGSVVRPALSDRLGWAIFIGTPKGRNHLYDRLEHAKMDTTGAWFFTILKASQTGILSKQELDQARAEMSEEEYEQEYECDFSASLTGAYYGKYIREAERENRITDLAHDPTRLVYTYWDLGLSDTTAIWFIQQVANFWHVIDYYEMSGEGLPYYAKYLSFKPYNYGGHILPHDGNKRNYVTEETETYADTLRGLGLKNVEVLPRKKTKEGIEAVRMTIPRCKFDKNKTGRGLDALKNYQKEWDANNKIYQNKPKHDWSSHGADAFRTFAMGKRDDQTRLENRSDLPRQSLEDYDELAY